LRALGKSKNEKGGGNFGYKRTNKNTRGSSLGWEKIERGGGGFKTTPVKQRSGRGRSQQRGQKGGIGPTPAKQPAYEVLGRHIPPGRTGSQKKNREDWGLGIQGAQKEGETNGGKGKGSEKTRTSLRELLTTSRGEGGGLRDNKDGGRGAGGPQ